MLSPLKFEARKLIPIYSLVICGLSSLLLFALQAKKAPLLIPNEKVFPEKAQSLQSSYWGLNFLYIGPDKDSIYIHKESYFPELRKRSSSLMNKRLKEAAQNEIEFQVLNHQIIKIAISQEALYFPEKQEQQSPAYPILIRNLSPDSIRIGLNHYLRVQLEMIENENWIPLNRFNTFGCGVGIGQIALGPGEIAISALPLYENLKPGKYRLHLEPNLHSNSFEIQ
ncbi:hypothetical protein [Croceimicrobium hydrocarbonivorans]|uniref:Uncharacterized protein n=1 Tax=Croceimicrobium hydrocarbonivorans TaxID=2761580 RepID=A0A7H0VI04_9FLAO|nr:hypothetical protein [Croceimicrobium hydrocarbonivorans]QNR25352.1 hypothetical protein H4K34_05795 [Croceimicrobium hydrocarbonivorans]